MIGARKMIDTFIKFFKPKPFLPKFKIGQKVIAENFYVGVISMITIVAEKKAQYKLGNMPYYFYETDLKLIREIKE